MSKEKMNVDKPKQKGELKLNQLVLESPVKSGFSAS
jgi:hypothetical protein